MKSITVKIDPDLLELIPVFMENRLKDLVILKEALAHRDFEMIQMIGHSMKGFGAGYGFEDISRIGREMELAAKAGEFDLVASCLKELEHYLEHVVLT